MTAQQFVRFAKGAIHNYRALAGWVRRKPGGPRGGISLVKAQERRMAIDVKASAILEVYHLVPEMLSAQRELTKAIAERCGSSGDAEFFFVPPLPNEDRKS